MTREQAMIAGAWAAGEVVQFRSSNANKWIDYDVRNDLLLFNACMEWRVKPKAREVVGYFGEFSVSL